MKSLNILTGVVIVSIFSNTAVANKFEDVTALAGFSGLNSSWGSSWADFDNDGDLDVITISHVQPHTASISQIWLNNGDETFSDVTTEAGYLYQNGDSHGVVSGDFDNDGDQDFYMVKGSKKIFPEHEHDLMMNNGDGTFSNVATTAGVLGIDHRGRGGYAVDFDIDGDLDLFFTSFSRGSGDFGNMLFRNDGDMMFSDVAAEAGIARDDDQNRTASWADYNNDGYPDLLVMYPCTLYTNQRDGTFLDTTEIAGITSHTDCSSSAWADYDNDGFLDLYITSGGDGNSLPTTAGFLYKNNGDGSFSDVTSVSGTENPYDARGVVWGDYDNDGWQDLYIVNDSNSNANRLFKNQKNGTFLDMASSAGAEGYVKDGAGVDATLIDYNNDGALDIFVVNGRASHVGEYLLLKNQGNSNNWLKIKLVGNQSNRDGNMARVEVTTAQGWQMREHNGPSHYMAQDNIPLHFGLGDSPVAVRVKVKWPSGIVQVLENVSAGQSIEIVEQKPLPPAHPPSFVDVSSAAGFYGMNASWAGSWSDFDRDGDLDIYTVGHVPGKTGSVSQLWQNNGDGTFSDRTADKSLRTDFRDAHAILWADLDNDGYTELAIGKGSIRGDFGDELWKNDNGEAFENIAKSAKADFSPIGRGISAVDYDIDGDLDLLSLGFLTQVGVSNRFFRNDGNMLFSDVTSEVGALADGKQNRVAAWADYNADGLPDIIVAPSCTLLRNKRDGSFVNVTGRAGILRTPECASVAWGDYDNDGDLDLYVTSGNSNGPTLTKGFLYQNNGSGGFTDVTELSSASNPYNARGVAWGDYDNDGFLDLYIVNGENEIAPNRLLRNSGDGTFLDVTASAGVAAQVAGGGTDGSFADYNNDGFLDLFVTNGMGDRVGPYVLLENRGNENHWLKVQLEGNKSNRDGIMTKLTVETSSGASLFREHNGQSHYMAQDSTPVHFGLGREKSIARLELTWPNGKQQVLENILVDQTITISEGRSIVSGVPKLQDAPGCYIWHGRDDWQLRCIGDETLRYDFSGTITSNGIFTSVNGVNFEFNDELTWDDNNINFDLHSRLRHDTILFSTTGDTVSIDLFKNGSRQPDSLKIGRHNIMPSSLPVTVTK